MTIRARGHAQRHAHRDWFDGKIIGRSGWQQVPKDGCRLMPEMRIRWSHLTHTSADRNHLSSEGCGEKYCDDRGDYHKIIIYSDIYSYKMGFIESIYYLVINTLMSS